MNTIDVIETLKKHNVKLFIMITGGGTAIVPKLLENGGASDVFFGAEVPYSYAPSGVNPAKFVSQDYAEQLANDASYKLMCYLPANPPHNLLSIGCTSSLMKNSGERDGRVNEAFVCFTYSSILGDFHKENIHIILQKTSDSTRKSQEDSLTKILYHQLAFFLKETVGLT